MNIVILSHYFPPEIGAPQARLSEMARAWVAAGHDVSVITCFPNHPTGVVPPEYADRHKKMRRFDEVRDGVDVHRCWSYATPNRGFLKKILGHLSFMVTSVVQAHACVKGTHAIIVSSPTFFSVLSAWFLSRVYRVPYVFEVRDLWPAIFVELGVLKNRVLIAILESVELFLYKRSAAVVAVTSRFRDAIIQRGVRAEKVHVITNGVDLDRFYPRQKDEELLDELEVRGKFIALYIGAHGISHALTRIVDAAELTADREDILFLFVGEGAEKEKVREHARRKNLTNCRFLPGRPKDQVTRLYSIMDVGLVPLRNIALFDTFIPSKMFEIMGMAKPIVASVRGEAADILHSSGGALVNAPEDAEAIAANVLKLYQDEPLRKRLGESGRAFAAKHYCRKLLADTYIQIIASHCRTTNDHDHATVPAS